METEGSIGNSRTPTTRAEGLSARTAFGFQKDNNKQPFKGNPIFKNNITRLFETPEWDSEISLATSERKYRDDNPLKESILLTDYANENNSPSSGSPQRFDMRKGGFWSKNKTGKEIQPSSSSKIDIMKLKKFLFENDETIDNIPRTAKTAAKTDATERSVYSYNPYSYGNLLTESSIQELGDNSRESLKRLSLNSRGYLGKKQGSLALGNKKKSETKKFSNIAENRVFRFINMIRLIRRRLRARYLKNRFEVYKYNPREDPPVTRITKRNKMLVKRRNGYKKEDEKFQQMSSMEVQENSKVEVFDFMGYTSPFNNKEILKMAAGTTDLRLGRTVKAGFVQKIINNSPAYHQRWLILRSFYLFWYKFPSSGEAKEVTALQIAPLKSNYVEKVRNECIILENSKGKEVTFVNDSEWVDALNNEIAYRRYMEYCLRQGSAPKASLVEYFENENCKVLDNSNEIFFDQQLSKLLFKSLFFHPKLKELNLSKTDMRGTLLQDLMEILSSLKKHSKIEVLILDSNEITKDMVDYINKYLESESSFSIKKFSICNNPIGDEAMQSFIETISARFEKMNLINKGKPSLPFSELGLSGTRMGDQTIFTMMTFFDQINRAFKDRGIEEHREGMILKMADNMITDNGMRAFSKILGRFQALRELDFSNNTRLTTTSFTNLMNGLKKNLSVIKVGYTKNQIDPKVLAGLFGYLSDNFLLKRLSITFDQRLVETFLGVQEVTMDFYKVSENI